MRGFSHAGYSSASVSGVLEKSALSDLRDEQLGWKLIYVCIATADAHAINEDASRFPEGIDPTCAIEESCVLTHGHGNVRLAGARADSHNYGYLAGPNSLRHPRVNLHHA